MHNDNVFEASENTRIPKPLMVSKILSVVFFCFSKIHWFWFFNGNVNYIFAGTSAKG